MASLPPRVPGRSGAPPRQAPERAAPAARGLARGERPAATNDQRLPATSNHGPPATTNQPANTDQPATRTDQQHEPTSTTNHLGERVRRQLWGSKRFVMH